MRVNLPRWFTKQRSKMTSYMLIAGACVLMIIYVPYIGFFKDAIAFLMGMLGARNLAYNH